MIVSKYLQTDQNTNLLESPSHFVPMIVSKYLQTDQNTNLLESPSHFVPMIVTHRLLSAKCPSESLGYSAALL
ncbi:hypothetical protein RRG08_033350 [Elysia crispata]|uniref:Uncharacterized protein n=1 Tax=Elysia crispata TaxID=231223 RepID=A0AAE0Z7M8_9GAST|nr:hypothetical protein RRG08_033350 [Elysia crispata]